MSRWRAVWLVGFLVATWAGCSGKSEHQGGAPGSTVGQGGAAGSAGIGANGGSGGEGAASGAENEGGNGTPSTGGATAGAGHAGTGTGAFAGVFVGAGGATAGVGGATAGAGGSSGAARGGNSGVAGTGNVPNAWGCPRSAYGDGKCDCGCGVPDIDCTKADIDRCESCNLVGSCNRAECPGRIDPKDVTTCLAPPDGWTCSPAAYGDGTTCDCGCGVQDLDCPDLEPSSCDSCKTSGSCAYGPCPGKLAPDDNTTCYVPPRWTCDPATYGDGTCNCGCGVVDVDCPDANASSCVACPFTCSGDLTCTGVQSDDNAFCVDPPYAWKCPARLYHDGVNCDCGCGAADPDCESLSADACDKCDSPGSCSVAACPGLISADRNYACTQPPAPDGWLCQAAEYGDAYCECGCGVPDIDCPDADASSCESCTRCAGTCDNLDPTDSTQCKSVPSGWTCSAAHYWDYQCDCGCGAPDPSCEGVEASYECTEYPVEGCSGGHPQYIQASRNELCTIAIPSAWTCNRGYYGDGVCDCGCGAVDPDCASKKASDCDHCNDDGSCSTADCPGSVLADDNAHCSN